jgi:hypothetical protein
VTSEAGIRGPNTRWAVTIGGNWEQSGTWDWLTIPGGQNGNGPLTGGPGPVKSIFKFSNSTQNCKFKKEAFPCPKNIKTLYMARLEYFEQLSQLGRVQILNRNHVINSGTEFNLNLP